METRGGRRCVTLWPPFEELATTITSTRFRPREVGMGVWASGVPVAGDLLGPGAAAGNLAGVAGRRCQQHESHAADATGTLTRGAGQGAGQLGLGHGRFLSGSGNEE